MSYIVAMRSDAFIRRLKRIARAQNLPFRIENARGKGSHKMVHVGARKTTVPKSTNLKIGLRRAIARQLGLDPDDLR